MQIPSIPMQITSISMWTMGIPILISCVPILIMCVPILILGIPMQLRCIHVQISFNPHTNPLYPHPQAHKQLQLCPGCLWVTRVSLCSWDRCVTGRALCGGGWTLVMTGTPLMTGAPLMTARSLIPLSVPGWSQRGERWQSASKSGSHGEAPNYCIRPV